ncbi:hypothetical protein CAMRE0001_1756 [Campylobacter rectus RM3267]|uniref:Uncharacterized protein n=1 Tax=Campylobacter rectus RM3267 TaxID=553218 RepID=B9CYD7_CAMRE|nr:hypothetical protein CAMRE0001_1756 [Campylobacter rectus RM3267]
MQYKPKPPDPEQIKRFDDTINFYSKHSVWTKMLHLKIPNLL